MYHDQRTEHNNCNVEKIKLEKVSECVLGKTKIDFSAATF